MQPIDSLVAELVDHRDDIDRYLVLADALQTRGDVRGELIAIQCRLATSGSHEIRKRERKLIARFEAELRGTLPIGALTFEWRYGFVHRVAIEASVSGHSATWRRIGEDPRFQLVRSLQFRHEMSDDAAVVPAIDALLAAPLATVEEFSLGTPTWIPIDDVLGELVNHFPRLHAFELAALQVPELSVLSKISDLALWVVRTEISTLDRLMAAPLPLLRRLVFGLSSGRPRVDESYAAFAPLLDGRVHSKIEHLALMRHGFSDLVIADLASRAILPRLRSIGVEWDHLSQYVGLPALERSREAFAHLQLVWPRPAGVIPTATESYHLGVALLELGRALEALPHYKRACELAPKDASHWRRYGDVLGELGRPEEQLAAYARAPGRITT